MRDLLNEIIDAIQGMFPVNRIVALLMGPIALAAGACSVWLTEHFPGLEHIIDLSPGAVAAVFISGVTAVVIAAYKWLDGWQLDEERQATAREPELGEPDPDADFLANTGSSV